jgi:hypothetical protein
MELLDRGFDVLTHYLADAYIACAANEGKSAIIIYMGYSHP